MLTDNGNIKIKIYGVGGQGVKFLGKILGKVLNKYNYEFVSVNANYDTVVRGGSIDTDIVASKNKVGNPIIDKANFCIILSKVDKFISAEKYIVDMSLKDELELEGDLLFLDITDIDEVLNMFLLGKLLKIWGMELDKELIKEVLPKNKIEQNINAVERGYNDKILA